MDGFVKTHFNHLYNQSAFFMDKSYRKRCGNKDFVFYPIYEYHWLSSTNILLKETKETKETNCSESIRYRHYPTFLFKRPYTHDDNDSKHTRPTLLRSKLTLCHNTSDNTFVFQRDGSLCSSFYQETVIKRYLGSLLRKNECVTTWRRPLLWCEQYRTIEFIPDVKTEIKHKGSVVLDKWVKFNTDHLYFEMFISFPEFYQTILSLIEEVTQIQNINVQFPIKILNKNQSLFDKTNPNNQLNQILSYDLYMSCRLKIGYTKCQAQSIYYNPGFKLYCDSDPYFEFLKNNHNPDEFSSSCGPDTLESSLPEIMAYCWIDELLRDEFNSVTDICKDVHMIIIDYVNGPTFHNWSIALEKLKIGNFWFTCK